MSDISYDPAQQLYPLYGDEIHCYACGAEIGWNETGVCGVCAADINPDGSMRDDDGDPLAWAKEAGFLNDDGTLTLLGADMPGLQP